MDSKIAAQVCGSFPSAFPMDPNRLYDAGFAAEPERLYGNSRRIQFESEHTTSVDAAIAEFGCEEWQRGLTNN